MPSVPKPKFRPVKITVNVTIQLKSSGGSNYDL